MPNILVVDDQVEIRGLLREALQNAGHSVQEAGDGYTALTLLRRHAIDLLVTDILMPDKDGLGLIDSVREYNSTLPIIAISGGAADAQFDPLAAARSLGAARTFAKPFGLPDLLQAVAEVLSLDKEANQD